MKKKLTLFFMIILLYSAFGQMLEIGNGTDTEPRYGPFYNYYKNNRTQTLYLNSELPNMSSFLTMISFNIDRIAPDPFMDLVDFSVKFKLTSDESLSEGAFYDMTDATEVFYSDPYHLASNTGWNDIDIDDFQYDGSSNLIIEITWGQLADYAPYDSYCLNLKTLSPGVTRMLYGYDDSVDPPAYDGSDEAYSNIQIYYTPLEGYPEAPSNPFPINHALEVGVDEDISWSFGDDTETYDLYFGSVSPPVNLVIEDETAGDSGSYDPGTLTEGVTYYWRVVTKNSTRNETYGPVWSFTTVFPPADEDFESGGFGAYEWSFGGNANWMIANTDAYSGTYCAQSGDIDDSQSTDLSISIDVTDNSQIIFFKKVSSESNYDYLRFYIDDEEMDAWSGDIDWSEEIFPVTVGYHTFKWEYSKDSSMDSGSDCAWIDYITFPATQVFEHDISLNSITGAEVVNANSTEIYEVSVKNVGTQSLDSYTVHLKKNGTTIHTLEINESIEPEEIATHNMMWTIPADEPEGTAILSAEVEMEGDENSNNNESGNLVVEIYPPGVMVVHVGDGTSTEERIPMCFYYKNSLTESIFMQDEIGMTGLISHLQFYNDFESDLYSMPTKIWLGETNLSDLVDGWIPASQLTLVYDGMVDFPSGENAVYIPLDAPFSYQTGNLVMMVQRPWDENIYSISDKFYYTETTDLMDRTRYNRDNEMEYDPYNPPADSFTFEKFPNTSFYFMIGGVGTLQGYVYDENNEPMENVEINRVGTSQITYSNQEGLYQLSNVPIGEHDFSASAFGYETLITSIEIEENETTFYNFEMEPLSSSDVYGQVVGSDQPEVGLQNATVTLTGMNQYESITNENGVFSIPDVFMNQTYQIHIEHENYTSFSDEILITPDQLDLGTFILNELTVPPGNVVATQNEEQTQVQINWNSPGQGNNEFRYDDGNVTFQIGYSLPHAVLGAVHRNIAIIHEISWYLTSAQGSHSNVKLYLFGLDSEGNPDQSNLLYESDTVSNIDDQWNSYTLPSPVECYNGFLVGVSTPNVYTSVGLDDGIGEPWAFQMETQFAIDDWTSNSASWYDIGNEMVFQRNLMIRAYGINIGEVSSTTFSKPVIAKDRSFEGYNIYRFESSDADDPDQWNLMQSSLTDTVYVDDSWHSLPVGEYQFAVTSLYTNDVESFPALSNVILKTLTDTDINEVIAATELGKNYPNPFNPTTEISFSLQNESFVTLEVYNIKGQKVKTLIKGGLEEGKHSIEWDGKDDQNRSVSSGIFFYTMKTDLYTSSKKMILLK